MKVLAALVTLFAFNPVFAEVKPALTILPTSCASEVQSTRGATQVCFSSITGVNGSFLTIGDEVWAVVQGKGLTQKISHVGLNVKGRLEYRMTTVERVGHIERGAGDTVDIYTSEQTLRASKFMTIFHTQGNL